MAWWKIETDEERKQREQARRGEGGKKKPSQDDKKKQKRKRTVSDDLTETKEIISQLREIQKKVSALKKQGRGNPKLDNLLESIGNESYKICLKC